VIFAASINAGLQLAAEPAMRGRVMALYSVVFIGSTPIGGPIAGWLGETVSPRASLLLGAVAAAGVAAFALSYWARLSQPLAARS
jgi:MFS family permease